MLALLVPARRPKPSAEGTFLSDCWKLRRRGAVVGPARRSAKNPVQEEKAAGDFPRLAKGHGLAIFLQDFSQGLRNFVGNQHG